TSPYTTLFRSVDLGPCRLAAGPDVTHWPGPIHVIERTGSRYLDSARWRHVPKPGVAMGAKMHGNDIAAVGGAVIALGFARKDLKVLVAHDHGHRPAGARIALAILAVAIIDGQRLGIQPIANRAAATPAFDREF